MDDEIAALAYIKKMAEFSLKKREDIEKTVRIKFKKVLEDASVDCDFYKDYKVPFQFLTKEDVRKNIHAGMISQKYLEHPGLVLDRTSGSAGDTVPFAYLQGYHRYARMVFSFLMNTGWRWAEKYCVFSTVHCSKDRCSTDDLPSFVNRVKLPTSDDIFRDKEILDRASTILKENQQTIIHADPFYLCAVAVYLEAQGISLTFKGISSTYELLTPSIKKYLEKIFKCKVFDSYGCSEFGSIAFACKHGEKHIFEDCVFVEIMDQGQYLDPEIGEIVVTSLENPAMPLIRYRTGDLGKLITDPCLCKRTAQRLEIYGRDSQCVSLNGVLYTERDIALLMDIPGVLIYQLTQRGNIFEFNILLENGYADRPKQQKIEQDIKDKFDVLGVNFISVTFVDHISPEKSGKFKMMVAV